MQGSSNRSSGFTLLEMLVVLALLALAAGVVAPRASRWLGAAQERGWRTDLKARIETLPVKAFLAGVPLEMDARKLQEGLPEERPAGVELRLERPLRYGATGVASGGVVDIVSGEMRERWVVSPITGAVQEQP